MRHQVHIEKPVLHAIVDRLQEAAGLDPGSLDARRMQWVVERRCRHLHLPSGAEYLTHLGTSPDELDELVDSLVIQETRFFRDAAVFEQIATWARSMAANVAGPLRLLSAPCSTGQEAYSLAGSLHHAGIPLEGFCVDAFDISRTALAAAERGVYPEKALKDVERELQAACGQIRNHHWRMHDELRGRIRFARVNLAEPGALSDHAGYHLILCRNLFIYLHSGARKVLAQSLAKALLPGGRLIVGAGDRVPELNALFATVKPISTFAYTHRQQVLESAIAARVAPAVIARRSPRVVRSPEPIEEPAAPVTAADFYRSAVRHHAHGDLRKAEHRCRQALYLAPGYLPALELLQKLWHAHPSERVRKALEVRIHRVRGSAAVEHPARVSARIEGA